MAEHTIYARLDSRGCLGQVLGIAGQVAHEDTVAKIVGARPRLDHAIHIAGEIWVGSRVIREPNGVVHRCGRQAEVR